MLTKESLVELFDSLGTPAQGRELVLRARVEAPVRPVQSQGGNVITFMASRKMGREIRTESLHIEFAANATKEFDPTVLEYYAQPCVLKLELIDDVTGEIRNIQHTPDFLVITDRSITLEEWKSEAKLERLAERYPYRFKRGSDGNWYAPQIERQLAAIGISYRVCSDKSIPAKRVENLMHLADYFHPAAEPCPTSTLERLNAVLKQHGAVYLNELLSSPFTFDADEINKAIADNLVVVDMDREQLTQPSRCRLYRDETLRDFYAGDPQIAQMPGHEQFVVELTEGTTFRYDSHELTIQLLSESDVVCARSDGAIKTLTKAWLLNAIQKKHVHIITAGHAKKTDLSQYSETELKVALARNTAIDSDVPLVCDRTLRRWVAKKKAVLVHGGNEIIALVPHTKNRGNRTQRLSEEQQILLWQVFTEKWASHEAPNYKACYRVLVTLCESKNIKPPSYPTLIERFKEYEDTATLRARHGKRQAYQLSEFVDVLHVDTPAHGSRPFQYVHIDHTQLDLELISSRTGKSLGRPWLTIAIDAFSRRIVALYLTFDPPSYHSVMMVLRDMVRRFGRLPEFIVVDNGKEFLSTAFETFLLALGVHIRWRPAGRPRHGAIMERIFGRSNTEYIHNLAGNTKAMVNVRQTTGKHLPVNFAQWTLESAYYGLRYWATEYYEQEHHPALGFSPREAFERGLSQSGARPQRQILFNEDFLIASCPPVDRTGLRQVHAQRGVKVNDQLYWHADFRDPRYSGKKWPVRYDPWDASSVYVRLKDQWVRAQCRNLMGLGQLTDLECRALTEEYTHANGTPANDERARQRLREFMQVFTPEGALATAFDRQAENKRLYNDLQLSSIHPVLATPKTRLTEDISTHQVVMTNAHDQRATSPSPVLTSPQATVSDDFDDFGTF